MATRCPARFARLYGPGFAKGAADKDRLSDVLKRMDDHSLSQLVHPHQRGELEGKIKSAS